MEKLIFEKSVPGRKGYTLPKLDVEKTSPNIPVELLRQDSLNLPEVSESEIARHFVRLSHLNYNIEEGLYPLGSCTMKYNPKVNEVTAAMGGFANAHPLMKDKYAQGALELMYNLQEQLKQVTGFDACCLQPSAGSQGELTAILVFRAFHEAQGNTKRTKILIPDAAHGTNPASAAMAGYQIVDIKSKPNGMVDIEDLAAHCDDTVAGFMLTNPNTVGMFEANLAEIEKLIHGCGGLMYMDGANLNAIMGIVKPAELGFDCMHFNLHKTFSTPHGGGGPGAGPICCVEKLRPFLPVPHIAKDGDNFSMDYDVPNTIGKMHSLFGNFGVFVRAYTYILMCGGNGLRDISENAVVNANYLLSLIKDNYIVPFEERGMHEFTISADKQKKEYGVSAMDIAKRLLDYGYHAPTVYFPLIVHECMLIEPTETETPENLKAFAEAMNAIAKEAENNPELVKSSPQTTPIKRVNDALAARNLKVNWNVCDCNGGC